MRKALVVGIDHYEGITPLYGCVNDAHAVKAILERNADGTVNFSVELLVGTGAAEIVKRSVLRRKVEELFGGDDDVALFYFAGHGFLDHVGGYLWAGDSEEGSDGLSLADVVAFANNSRAKSRIIILDSCHSGVAGRSAQSSAFAETKEGVTIMTASTAEQYASEDLNTGVFTSLFVDALAGAAQNLVGEITPGSVYAHIDQSLGPWQQRPVFKTNVKNFVSLRKVQPPITLAQLQRISDLFPVPGFEYQLDPSFEPERGAVQQALPAPDPKNTEIFAVLQRFNRVNLVTPVGAPHMWHAAMDSKTCKLTVLGEHYRRLVARRLI